MSTQGFRYVVLLPAILAATWIWSSEQSYDEKLDAVMPEIPTEVLVTDAKKYLASGKFMQLDAIDGLIRETQAQAGQFGVTDAHRRCLAAFVAAVQKQGQRINRSNAARATVESLDKLQRFVRRHAKAGSTLYSDEAPAYDGMPEYKHKSVNHSKGQYVDGDAHTNGIESVWAPIKRSYKGTYHYMSRKHLHRYVTEFAGRNNARRMTTVDHMRLLVLGGQGKSLPWRKLTK